MFGGRLKDYFSDFSGKSAEYNSHLININSNYVNENKFCLIIDLTNDQNDYNYLFEQNPDLKKTIINLDYLNKEFKNFNVNDNLFDNQMINTYIPTENIFILT
jgi:predicted Zn-dependent protease